MGCKRYNLRFFCLFLAVLLSACNMENSGEVNLKPFTLSVDQKVTQAVNEILPLVEQEGTAINTRWKVVLNDRRGGLDISIPSFRRAEFVNLPHRIQLPDHAIWYQAEVELEQGVLRVNADDGAQLWLNEERIVPEVGGYHAVAKDGKYTLTIRVLNNAMAGGLRAVRSLNDQEWQAKTALSERRKLLRGLLSKKALLLNLSEYEKGLIEKAKHDPAIANLLAAAKQLTVKPILLAEPVFQKSVNGQLYLRWVSSSNANTKLVYGASANELTYEINVEGIDGVFLTAVNDSIKFYRIVQDEMISPVYIFPQNERSQNQQFMVWADSQSGWKVFDRIMRMSNQYLPHFSIGAGDLVGQGDDELEYLRLLRSMHRGGYIHYPVPGNHDYDGYYEDLRPNNYSKYLGLPNQQNYFAWKEGDLAFIALDLNETFPVGLPNNSGQYRWFMEQIQSEAWTSAKWRFLISHHPPYSQGWPGYHGEISLREVLEPLYEEAKIDMVIAGHTHDYERLIKNYGAQQIAFVVVGGAGGGLEPIENAVYPKMDTVMSIHHFGLINVIGDTLNFRAIDTEHKIIDKFSLTHE
ncbi:hypothetical protein GBO34_18725 [Roseivirga pacifica]|uniref:metallophosphoesterase family protein n=2 Tax=Roseivirga pacifica TaxID=1267423 RepID=UPI002094310C|nr:metallophosphoesterase [Roseivirga pacifica]MCO6358044.1 hypothetical protein [Roseivirga pacifica]MCO6366482.1 hypothetical protein [Roseivirga pacifica]MCO6370967.1 hypothetical protein [Roseivirga pacifica]MCO6373775.1 hypothetical protein [Roseivirga pacifica]MCO6380756.1 hypothetical protein [Roseivirga pacifica]